MGQAAHICAPLQFFEGKELRLKQEYLLVAVLWGSPMGQAVHLWGRPLIYGAGC